MTQLRELDVVVLKRDMPDVGLCVGDVGAVVQLYSADAFEVEFITATGHTQALLTLRATDVRAAQADEMLAVRSSQLKGTA